jgi:hypothetical protein
MRNSSFIKVQTVPLLKQIEQSDRVGEPHLEICPHSLSQMFQLADLREQGKNRFNQHSVVPFAARADFQIFRLIMPLPETFVRQDNHFVANRFTERQEFRVGNIRRFDLPIGDESEFVCQNTELAAANPSPRSEAFLADPVPVRLMIFPNRMTQFDAVRINHAKDGRLGKKLFGQFPMRFQSVKKSGALRQSGKQARPVVPQPTVKSPLRCPFQSKQQTQSKQFASGKFGLIVFLSFRQHIIYPAKKFYDKVFLSHGICLLLCLVWSPLQ